MIDSVGAREEAARALYFYFDHTDVDPGKAAYYEAIWHAMFDR